MLYDLWQDTVRARPRALALHDLASGQSWTFSQLDQAASQTELPHGFLVHPQGMSPAFLLTLLAAWKARRVVCPLEQGQAPPSIVRTPDNCVHLKMTSASTGAPRMVGFLAEQLVADASNIMVTMGLRHEWPNLAVISLAHSYGFSNLVLPLALHGIPLVLCPSPMPEMVAHATRTLQSVTLPAVPALWHAWHQAGTIRPAIRLAISAGAPLPLQVEHAVHRDHNLKIHNFYGATECGGIAFDPSDTPRTDPRSVGLPLHGVRVACNQNGCLVVQSRAVGQTYWPDPNDILQAGRFETGDLATITHGEIHIHGRLGDAINVAGRKVQPESIENALRRHPAVRDCLVFGVDSPTSGRGAVIVSIVATHVAIQPTALRAFLQQSLPAWQIPREWLFVDSLQPNQRGKLSRADWRQHYLQNALSTPTAIPPLSVAEIASQPSEPRHDSGPTRAPPKPNS